MCVHAWVGGCRCGHLLPTTVKHQIDDPKVASLVMMVGPAADVMSLMGMALMESTLMLSARKMRTTTTPPIHNQVSAFIVSVVC